MVHGFITKNNRIKSGKEKPQHISRMKHLLSLKYIKPWSLKGKGGTSKVEKTSRHIEQNGETYTGRNIQTLAIEMAG